MRFNEPGNRITITVTDEQLRHLKEKSKYNGMDIEHYVKSIIDDDMRKTSERMKLLREFARNYEQKRKLTNRFNS